jgi:hypothetical protein
MRAECGSAANGISIAITESPRAEREDEAHPRAIVGLAGAKPVEVKLLYPDLGITEPLAVVAERFGLDLEAQQAATSPRSRLPIESWCSRWPPARRA